MKTIPIVQIGLGGVGQVLVQQILAHREALAAHYGFWLDYVALADSTSLRARRNGLAVPELEAALAAKAAGQQLSATGGTVGMTWRSLALPQTSVFVDVSAAAGHHQALAERVTAGHRVVLANKKPLSADYPAFQALTARGATRYEATVGAGLPVISTLQGLLDSGDTPTCIEAAMSGTLGFLCTALEAGQPLSAAVREALCLEKGDTLAFEIADGGAVTVRKAVALDQAFADALQSQLSEWASDEDDEAYESDALLPQQESDLAAAPLPVMAGKKCGECGAHAVIRKDGCDYCTQCGHVGSCG